MSFDLQIVGGDIAINRDGSVALVRDNDKLRQDIVKILLTRLGENKYHPQYGSEVGALQIGSIPDPELLELDLSSSAESAIRKLISLQRSQARRGQFQSPGEVIVEIKGIEVARDEADPRLYNIFISVITQKLTLINDTITVRII